MRWEDIRFSPQVMYVQPGTINKQQFRLSPKRFTKHHLTYMCAILILNSYDCHPNPGPRTPKFPCGECGKAVKWSKTVLSVACTECETWYHKDCLGMNTEIYLPLEKNPDLSWYCCQCGLPNFHTSLFEDFNLSLSSDTISSTPSSVHTPPNTSFFGDPILASSPKKEQFKKPLESNKARILSINFQSIRPKREAFWSMLENTDPDIILASETWLNSTIYEREVLPENYVFAARKDRPYSSHGGVAIITKANIDASEIVLDTPTEMVAASIPSKDNSKPIIVCSIYRPTNNDVDYTNKMCATLRELHRNHLDHTLWIGGDANLPDINWACDSVEGHNYPTTISQQFIDIFSDLGCQQVIDFPTRGSNILDIFATNRPSLLNKARPLPGLSNHDIVLIDINTTPHRRRPVRRLVYLWAKADTEAISSDLAENLAKFQQHANNNAPVDVMWNDFKKICTHSINAHVPSKFTSCRFSQPWCDRNIRRLSRRKRRAHRRARITNTQNDWRKYREAQSTNRKECRKSFLKYINNMLGEEGHSNKKLYSYIKSKRCDSSGVSPLRNEGLLHSSPKEKAEILNQQFSSVFHTESLSNLPDLGQSTYPVVNNIKVTEKGVLKLLQSLNPNKASGPDNISARFLNAMATSVSPILTIIFQSSLDQGKVPDDWKTAYVTPLFKKGDKSRASYYRPVSLTSICCKTLEHIVHSHVINHLERNNILSDQQHGFRKRRSCESQLITTIHDLASSLDQRQQVDAVLLDFSKAFDKVPHHRLALKLEHYGVRGQTLEWISSFLSDRSQQVVVDGEMSSAAPVTSGVPQGTVLGPLLFLVYINDLPSRVKSTARLFADDCLLYRRIVNEEDTITLQEDLNQLQVWESEWLMSFNPEKCEVIRITNKRRIIEANYSIHGQTLQFTTKAKYLGVTIDNKLNWGPHINNITRKANNTTAFLSRNLSGCPRSIKATSYKTLVRPQVEYASTVWDHTNKTHINKIEAVQRRAARYIMGDYSRESSVTSMLNHLHLDTLQSRRITSRATMMYRIVNGYIDIPSSHLHPVNSCNTRGHTMRFLQPFCHLKCYQDSFFPAGVVIWNSLSPAIVTADSLEAFKARISPRSYQL